jgi:hypothetical protein
MPDYVYALHDFLPENDDEVSFRQGERVEVIERDDLYNDGWWQVSYIHFQGRAYLPDNMRQAAYDSGLPILTGAYGTSILFVFAF